MNEIQIVAGLKDGMHEVLSPFFSKNGLSQKQQDYIIQYLTFFIDFSIKKLREIEASFAEERTENMLTISELTSLEKATIPDEVIRILKLEAGDKILWLSTNDDIILRKVVRKSLGFYAKTVVPGKKQ